MKLKITGSLLFSLGLAALFLFLLVVTNGYGYKTKLVPMVVLIPGFIASLIQVGADLKNAMQGEKPAKPKKDKAPAAVAVAEPEEPVEEEKKEKLSPEEKRKRQWIAVGWLFFPVVLILIFGMSAAIPIFVIAYMRFGGRESWRLSFSIAAVMWVFVYVVFVWGMRSQLYDGWVLQQLQR